MVYRRGAGCCAWLDGSRRRCRLDDSVRVQHVKSASRKRSVPGGGGSNETVARLHVQRDGLFQGKDKSMARAGGRWLVIAR